MDRLKTLVSQVDLVSLISQDFELKEYSDYSKGIEHDSLVVLHDKNIFYWNSMGIYGDALDWLVKIKGMFFNEAIALLKELTKSDFNSSLGNLAIEQRTSNIYQKLLETFFELGKTHRDYWYERGYTDATIDKFKLGYTGREYVIPMIIDEQLHNFQCISPYPKKRIWSWSKGLGPMRFNFDILKQPLGSIILAEGPTDAIMLGQHNISAISQTGGSGNWLPAWNNSLDNVDQVIIMYDNDPVGLSGGLRTATRYLTGKARIFVWPKEYPLKYDISDFFNDGNTRVDFISLVGQNIYPPELLANKELLHWILS